MQASGMRGKKSFAPLRQEPVPAVRGFAPPHLTLRGTPANESSARLDLTLRCVDELSAACVGIVVERDQLLGQVLLIPGALEVSE